MEDKRAIEVTSTRGLAEALGWPTSRVTQMCRAGQIKAYKVKGRWWIPREEAERFLSLGPIDREIMLVKAAIERSRLVRVMRGKATPSEVLWFGLGFGRGRYATMRLFLLHAYLAYLKTLKFFKARRYKRRKPTWAGR